MLRAMVFRNFVHFRDTHVLDFREGRGATYFIGASSTGKTAVLELVRRCMSSKQNSSVTNRFNEKEHGFVFCQFEKGTDNYVTAGMIVEGAREENKQTSAEQTDANNRQSLSGENKGSEKDGTAGKSEKEGIQKTLGEGEKRKSSHISHSSDGGQRGDETCENEIKNPKEDKSEVDVRFHKIMIDQSCNGNPRIRSKTFFLRQEKIIDSQENFEYYPNESDFYNQEKLEKMFKSDKSGYAAELVKGLLAVIEENEEKNTLRFAEDPWEKLTEQYVGVLSWRGLGTFQWTKSRTIFEEFKKQNYKEICEQAEIITDLIESDDIEDEKEKRIFSLLTEPNVFVFRKEEDGIFVTKDDIKFPLLKLSVGIVEAKQFALLLSHKHLRTICLEEPERGMHPQMIERMKSILYRECEDKTVIITTHSPAFIDSITIESSFLFFRQKMVYGVRNIARTLSEKLLKVAEAEDLKKIFFSTKVLLVEGRSDKIVLHAIFNHIIGNSETDTKAMTNINSYQIIVLEGCLRADPIQGLCKNINLPCAAVLDRDTYIEVDGRGCVDAIKMKNFDYTDGEPINSFLEKPFEDLSAMLQTNENRFIWKDGDIEDFLLGERDKRDNMLKILGLENKQRNPRKAIKRSLKEKLKMGISQEESIELGKHLKDYTEVSRLCEFLNNCDKGESPEEKEQY